MTLCTRPRERDLRLAPLAAALVLACAGTMADASAAAPPPTGLSVAMPASWTPGNGSGVAALYQALRAVGIKPRSGIPAPAATTPVTSCADDNGSGTLRAVIAAAGESDTIDLSGLTCSVITLIQGAIPVMLNDLTVIGAGAGKLAIDGAGADRVFVHYGYGTFTLDALTVRNGASLVSGYHVAGGACILSGGFVTLDHSTVSGCVASGEGAYGGGILASGVTMYTSTLSGNVVLGSHPLTFTAAYGGGAFAYRGTAALYDSTVSGNRATFNSTDTFGSYDTGGGLFVDNGGYALRSTIEGNYSFGTGGGIASHAGFFVADSTISGNIAKAKAGGGMFVRLFDSMSIANSTIAHNTALKGGGIYLSGSPQALTMQSTIVADNTASTGADMASMSAVMISGANNLVVAADVGVTLPADTLHSDPKLLPLANNGGPTRTHALSVGSPAVDAGNNAANLATDQRGPGFPRVLGAAADIGAYESTQAPLVPPMAVPALSAWSLSLLAGLLGWFGLRRRKLVA
jgi:hypothetical protein